MNAVECGIIKHQTIIINKLNNIAADTESRAAIV